MVNSHHKASKHAVKWSVWAFSTIVRPQIPHVCFVDVDVGHWFWFEFQIFSTTLLVENSWTPTPPSIKAPSFDGLPLLDSDISFIMLHCNYGIRFIFEVNHMHESQSIIKNDNKVFRLVIWVYQKFLQIQMDKFKGILGVWTRFLKGFLPCL